MVAWCGGGGGAGCGGDDDDKVVVVVVVEMILMIGLVVAYGMSGRRIQRPLVGSSAGAVVCAVFVSGASMEEILQATKVLAEGCRSRWTAFCLAVDLPTFIL
ncbi:hypothetical protein Tco_1125611 [Tanacetum coccineum]|uniref:PNPLA domain-containing protein n=1 Tax=Tanacetum coccineum TaxID=301880 RepID=A0ABQ5JA54_9ASTR